MRFDVVAIVPAGGEARRLEGLGRAGKATLAPGGRSFLDRVCTVLAAECARVIVVAPADRDLPPVAPAAEIVRDSVPRAGPLAAVRDGLAHALATGPVPRLAVVCACDMPLVKPGVVRLLVERAGPGVRWVVPVVRGHPQPLLSALAADLLPRIEAQLARGRAGLRALIDDIDRAEPGAVLRLDPAAWQSVDPGLESFLDVDTAADLADVSRRMDSAPRGG